ncbi:MAG: DNA-3-methyladenine glycosylase 2 family protein [Candidatus Lambdaproteobacteria bacterium]|nr:DNA-3-methyladenine glycosylase 2 family protein [Candidatus Lambdaproteobacteria bacterium]
MAVRDDLEAAALRLLAGNAGAVPAPAAELRANGHTAGFTGGRTGEAFRRAFRHRFGADAEAFREFGRAGRYRFVYGAPFHLPKTIEYLARDPANQAERSEGNRYRRYLPLGGRQVEVTLTLDERGVAVAPRGRLSAGQRLHLHDLVRRVLGLDQPLTAFYRHVGRHPVMGPLVRALRGVRIIRTPTLWEALCWAILGQQINLAFAYRLRNRLIRLGQDPAAEPDRPVPALLPFPSPEQVLRIPAEALRRAQFSRQKSAYLANAARALLEGALGGLSPERHSAEEAEAALLAVKGIGRWSAAYGLMRGLGYLDAVPVGDVGLRIALQRQFALAHPPDAREQEALMEPFRPYRSLATQYLWRSLRTTAAE